MKSGMQDHRSQDAASLLGSKSRLTPLETLACRWLIAAQAYFSGPGRAIVSSSKGSILCSSKASAVSSSEASVICRSKASVICSSKASVMSSSKEPVVSSSKMSAGFSSKAALHPCSAVGSPGGCCAWHLPANKPAAAHMHEAAA